MLSIGKISFKRGDLIVMYLVLITMYRFKYQVEAEERNNL